MRDEGVKMEDLMMEFGTNEIGILSLMGLSLKK
jgi:hypothetical protein